VSASPYADLSRPPLHEARLSAALVTPGGLWTEIRVVPVTGSTNADVQQAARAGAREGLVIVAEHQLSGRGRLDRVWQSPPRAGLTFSLLLRPEPAVPANRLGWLPLLAGVCLAEAVGRLAQVEAVLKWPNDLLVATSAGYAKCAGILAEAVTGTDRDGSPAVVLGVGLNVSQRIDELPIRDPGAVPVTSLALAGAACTDRDPLLRAVLRRLAERYAQWCAAAGDPRSSGLRDAYSSACTSLGRWVRADLPGAAAVQGVAVELDEAGRLVVAPGDGEPVAVAAGDVCHLDQPA
jgi:BirA family transcriptional regulator, biotin operon repressor / biotin---[acetyl-CoA-carboxylase] ligase